MLSLLRLRIGYGGIQGLIAPVAPTLFYGYIPCFRIIGLLVFSAAPETTIRARNKNVINRVP